MAGNYFNSIELRMLIKTVSTITIPGESTFLKYNSQKLYRMLNMAQTHEYK